MNWKDVEGSGHGLIYKVLPQHLPGGTEEKKKTSVRVGGIQNKICTRDLPNTKEFTRKKNK
jgi:hypothetical protein